MQASVIDILEGLSHETPVDERIDIGRVGAGVEGSIARNNTDVAIVLFVKATSFDNSDAPRTVLGKSSCHSQTSSTASDDDVVESVIFSTPGWTPRRTPSTATMRGSGGRGCQKECKEQIHRGRLTEVRKDWTSGGLG